MSQFQLRLLAVLEAPSRRSVALREPLGGLLGFAMIDPADKVPKDIKSALLLAETCFQRFQRDHILFGAQGLAFATPYDKYFIKACRLIEQCRRGALFFDGRANAWPLVSLDDPFEVLTSLFKKNRVAVTGEDMRWDYEELERRLAYASFSSLSSPKETVDKLLALEAERDYCLGKTDLSFERLEYGLKFNPRSRILGEKIWELAVRVKDNERIIKYGSRFLQLIYAIAGISNNGSELLKRNFDTAKHVARAAILTKRFGFAIYVLSPYLPQMTISRLSESGDYLDLLLQALVGVKVAGILPMVLLRFPALKPLVVFVEGASVDVD